VKKLIWKEFRENLPVGVLALLFFVWLYGTEYLGFRALLERGVRGEVELSAFASPLRSGAYEGAMFGCAIFGIVLGWLQTSRERRSRVWEFLASRPMTLTSILMSKVVTGVAIYTAAAGLPLLVLALWVSRPGNVPAPFHWRMVAPFGLMFANGLLYYLGGLLAGARRARWYGSRTMAIGLPIIASAGISIAPHFGLILTLWLLVAVVLGFAAWASFHNFGYDTAMRPVGKPAAAIALAGGWIIAAFMAAVFLGDIFDRLNERRPTPWYTVRQNGEIYKATFDENGAARVTDLQGKPIIDPATGAPMALSALQSDTAFHIGMASQGLHEGDRLPWISRSFSGLVFWGSGGRSLWYYSASDNRLLGYDIVTCRFIGSLGPDGFAADRTGGGGRFQTYTARTLGTDTELFTPDLHRKTVSKVFATPAADPIVAVGGFERDRSEERKLLILTRNSASVITFQGRELYRIPYKTPAEPERSGLRAFMIDPPGSFILWSDPPAQSDWIRSNEPSSVTWVIDGRIAREAAIPPLRPDRYAMGSQEYLMAAGMPPILVAVLPAYKGFPWPPQWRQLLLVSTLAALVCVPITLFLGRRMGLNGKTLLAWCAAALCLGLPGLLAFLSIEEKHVAIEPASHAGAIQVFESSNRGERIPVGAL
jgi:hypothetical protein